MAQKMWLGLRVLDVKPTQDKGAVALKVRDGRGAAAWIRMPWEFYRAHLQFVAAQTGSREEKQE